ncbi:MAG: N-acetyl-gamma-glutamyl-phosphate reductase [Candidatus Omnitrophica bacterium]|nr:N-acetyl-gamma-glutamyl-phosphate reductase [Candidatus Omnitrophota bacterium]
MIAVGIIGVTGYTGQELLKILLRHPNVSVEHLSSRSIRKEVPLGSILPSFRNRSDLTIHPFDWKKATAVCDLLFLALPHGVSMKLASGILRSGKEIAVIDLSGDFRLASAPLFKRAYGKNHANPALLKQSIYGLSEWSRKKLPAARLVANPGCYPTAVLLGLGPLAAAGLLQKEGLVVDAKSGVTGAGKSVKEELLFSEVNEDLKAYRVDNHQHTPEIEQTLRRIAGRPVKLTFVPHLVPMNRGIYATIYAPLKKRLTGEQLRRIYQKRYAGEPFIRLLPEKVWPNIKAVSGTNFCEIGLQADHQGKRAIIISAIDNLVKGAAGQAVQNMNLLYGFPETAGLLPEADGG